MSLSKIGTSATASSTVQSTAAQAAPKGPGKAPASPALQSLRSTARTLADAGTGAGRRTAVLAAAAVSNMLVSVAEGRSHPALGAGAPDPAVGAQPPQAMSGGGSDIGKHLIEAAVCVAGALVLNYGAYQAYKYWTRKSSTPATSPHPSYPPNRSGEIW
jgi:hypothetical protein